MAVDVRRDEDRAALQGFDWSTRQRLVGAEAGQLEVVIHGDVRSEHLQLRVLHPLEEINVHAAKGYFHH